MNRPWTTSEFGRAAESARENFFASISWDAMNRWFASGRLRDSPGPGSCGGAARELLASLEQHGPKATLALVMQTHLGEPNPADILRVALMKLRITQQGILLVAETGRFLELVREKNLRKYIRARTALRTTRLKAPLFARFR